VTLIEPNGYVYNSVNNGGIGGATVTAYRFDPNQQSYVLWDAYPFGQVNPQHTNEQGQYGWQFPVGSYYLRVQHPDYIGYQSSTFSVPPGLNDFDIELVPIMMQFELYLPSIVRD
jgi:hypothetical protein